MAVILQEMDLGYFEYVHRPGERLGVLDNDSDYEACKTRVHCNSSHGNIAPTVAWDEQQKRYVLDDSQVAQKLERMNAQFGGRRHWIVGGAEHNNVYFPGFYHYKQNLPESLMQDMEGNYLELRNVDIMGGEGIPMPAIDDPTLLALYSAQLSAQASRLRNSHYVAAYVLGAEMLYPEFFGLGTGDYRPASWAHFTAWCRAFGHSVPSREETQQRGTPGWRTWMHFREQAMADRCRIYYKAVLDADDTHLVYYPTHGSTLHGTSRSKLGQQVDSLASACDGMEMGHILIDDDVERRNVIMTSHFTAYGAPVIIPRLGNKTPDLSAAGGGRSFTPQTLRRLVYECAGLGIGTIFPIHWRSCLHDGEWFIKDTPAEQECRAVFDELTQAAPYTTAMGRLQPQVGVLAADDTWLIGWQPCWTGILQDAYARHASMTVITDAAITDRLPGRMPVLLSVDNEYIAEETLHRLSRYLDQGGRLVVWGQFAAQAPQALREAILAHTGTLVDDTPPQPQERTLRELFLSGARTGVDGPRYRYHALDFDKLAAVLQRHAPGAVLSPFAVTSAQDTRDLNVYALTDRAALLAVCINNGPEPVAFTLAPDKRLLDGDYTVIDALDGSPAPGEITLEGYATRMLFIGPVADTQAMEDTVERAEDAFVAWSAAGAQVEPLQHYYSGMRSGPHRARRYALARALLASLALDVQCTQDAHTLHVRCRVLDDAARSVADARVFLRTVPGTFDVVPLAWDGEAYACDLPLDSLGLLYDADAQRYVPLQGALRLVLHAQTAGAQGGCIHNTRILEDGGTPQ